MRRVIVVALLFVVIIGCQSQQQTPVPGVEAFVGHWTLFLPGGAGWLEVRQEDGYLDGGLLWYGGSVTPVSSMFVNKDTLIVTRSRRVVRSRDENDNPLRTQTVTTWYEFVLQNGDLKGRVLQPGRRDPNINITNFTGKKLPPLPPPPDLANLTFGEPVELFNGEDLSGWTLTDTSRANGFKVENGTLVNDPVQQEGGERVSYGNLKTIAEFEDFNLTTEVNIPKGSNSGIYLKGIYEVQVVDSYNKPVDPHNMGGLYSRITPSVAAEKPAGEWQTFDITLCDRHLTVILNGKNIIDNQPVFGVTGGALTADEFSPGPIYLQGDHGKVYYRNMVLRRVVK